MIRQLKPGETVPEGEPRRYRSSHGYVRLRWRVGKGSYVEVYEHRVVDGVVTHAEQVHHINEVKDDNRPENLARISAADHYRAHRVIDRSEAIARYEAGESLPTIARAMNCTSAGLSRLLRDEGVAMRGKRDYYPSVTLAELEAAIGPDTRAPQLAAHFSVSIVTVYRWLREYEIRFPVGRPRRSA